MNKTEIKLKVAAEEIKEVLRKHDIAGAVSLHSPGHGEHFVHINPSYSCAYVYEDNTVRFYSKKADYKTPEEQFEKQANTSNMLITLKDITGINFLNLDQMSSFLDEKIGAEHPKPIIK